MQETNIKSTDDIQDFQIDGYDLLVDKMLEKNGLARTNIFISKKNKISEMKLTGVRVRTHDYNHSLPSKDQTIQLN